MAARLTPAKLADAIEKGRSMRPDWKVCREALYRRGSHLADDRQDATAACALGFAQVGLDTDRILDRISQRRVDCPSGDGYTTELSGIIIHLNDYHRWRPERIAEWLRAL